MLIASLGAGLVLGLVIAGRLRDNGVLLLVGQWRGVFWTRRALQREGYRFSGANNASALVKIAETPNGFNWTVDANGVLQSYATLADLLTALQTLKRS